MLLRTSFINLIFLHLIYTQLQINNLHLTQWLKTTDGSIQHDCLYIPVPFSNDYDERQIIAFCMSELPSKFHIRPNHIDPIYTFDELAKQNVTTEHLYDWSAPVDLIEQYQLYLNDPESLLGNETFFNCTLPYFGPQCQYVFKDLNYSILPLNKIIEEYYNLNEYEPMLLTCYIHLKCNRGPSPACLDWTEICDGKTDCLDGGFDEEHCWQLETVDRCDKNQYQCHNGQCIPETLKEENKYSFECIDQSDEMRTTHNFIDPESTLFRGPIFTFEDVSCAKLTIFEIVYSKRTASSCVRQREKLILYAIVSMKPISLSNECWTAFKCLIQIPIEDSHICQIVCLDGFCDEILKRKCPDLIYLSASPILFSHINLVFDKNNLRHQWNSQPKIKYVCFDRQQLYINVDKYNIFSFNHNTCLSDTDSIFYEYVLEEMRKNFWLESYIHFLRIWLLTNSVSIENNLTNYINSSLYKCQNWPKSIPYRRLKDNIRDCPEGDDEERPVRLDCSIDDYNENYFYCSNSICILKDYVNDGKCDCIFDEMAHCIDENITQFDSKYKSLFQQICDGNTDIEANHVVPYGSDETKCEYWPLIHVYNHCDRYWDILNGSDELNCDSSQPLNCSPNHHLCVSQQTNQIICLSINKTNDGIIDCIGAFDELNYCQRTYHFFYRRVFFCPNNTKQECIPVDTSCDQNNLCLNDDYEKVCQLNDNDHTKRSIKTFDKSNQSKCSDVTQFLCKQFLNIKEKRKVYFTLDRRMNPVDKMPTNEDVSPTYLEPSNLDRKYYHQRCHRGLDLEVYLDKNKNLTTNVCLCPPSFYGDTCQYQNQRISLTLQFRVSSDSVQIPFIIIISLIDNTFERIIHSMEQITYLSMKHCRKKFHIYLLYSTRSKDQSKEYFIHIDIYEKFTLKYRTSLIRNIKYSFLPVHRLVYLLDIPPQSDSIESCSNRKCHHGQCIRYSNDLTNQSFCQCQRNWTGQFCSIQYDCQCSSDALCLGQLANNRSLCVCPFDRKGPRCLIEDKICSNQTCSNRGQCVTLDEYDQSKNKSTCICDQISSDDFCRFNDTKLILSFNETLILPSSVSVHFIEIRYDNYPNRVTTSKHIYPGQYSIIIRWSLPFHLVFVEFNDQIYYLAFMQKIYKRSSMIESTIIQPSNRCLPITDLFNETIAHSHLMYRIKFYHQPCQRSELDLQCFYDNVQLCLCQQIDHSRVANCFDFDHKKKTFCTGINGCKNDGRCFQENNDCSRITLCQCPTCFYGSQCEINTNVFYLSLDAILGFRISPNVSLNNQPSVILISLSVTILLVLLGLLNASFSLMTFQHASTRESGCGVYLLCSSILIFLIMFFFLFKFLIVLLSQIGIITNYVFLNIQCYAIDFLFRSSLIVEQWLTAFVAIERALITLKGVRFRQKQAKFHSKWIIVCTILFASLTNIHDPLHRKLFQDNVDEQQPYWCIVEYSSEFVKIYNSFITIFHFIVPFIINIISAIIIIVSKTRQQILIQRKKRQESQLKKLLIEQIQLHKNLLIAPCVLTILGIPRLIMSFTSSCMTTTKDFWFYLIGNYISLIPSLLTFILFVLPSSTYKQAFQKVISRYRKILFSSSQR